MMKKILALSTAILLAYSCSIKNESDKLIYYIIENPLMRNNDIELPPPPPPIFYGNHNFILIDTSKVYYHNRGYHNIQGTGNDFSKPPFLDLKPDCLIEIKINNLYAFLKNNIPDSMFLPDSISQKAFTIATISTPTDTIKNRAFQIITEYFIKNNVKRYFIRHLTEEEQQVTTAKIEHKGYNHDSINWEIGFNIELSQSEKPYKK